MLLQWTITRVDERMKRADFGHSFFTGFVQNNGIIDDSISIFSVHKRYSLNSKRFFDVAPTQMRDSTYAFDHSVGLNVDAHGDRHCHEF